MKSREVMSLIIIALMLAPIWVTGLAYAFTPGTTPGGADFVVLTGTTHTDYYDAVQYSYKIWRWFGYDSETAFDFAYESPFRLGSLRLGLTEYGEFATSSNAGIAYGTSDSEFNVSESWASTEIDPKYWVQGWLLAMNYTRVGEQITLLAFAYYSNMTTTEAGRMVYSKPASMTWSYALENGYVHVGSLRPTGVKILYESPRLVVARTSTIIHDGYKNEDVAEVIFTIIFNKVSKYAIVLKDVKILLDPKILDKIDEFVFTERFEIDLARLINLDNDAFIHYYHNKAKTVYGHPIIPYGDGTPGWNKFDLLVAYNDGDDIGENKQYVFFAAYWPNATEYSVYSDELVVDLALDRDGVLAPGTAVADIPNPPAGPGEPSTPWVVVQWRFNITDYPNVMNWLANGRQIRFVEVIGMTDMYDTQDYNDTSFPIPRNLPGSEIWFLVNQVFNPEDLNDVSQREIVMNECKFVPDHAYILEMVADTRMCKGSFLWYSVGATSKAVDSAAAGVLTPAVSTNLSFGGPFIAAPFALFDTGNPLTPAPGSIPFGLVQFQTGGHGKKANYLDDMRRTALKGFAFGYDMAWYSTYYWEVYESPQPIAGGFSELLDYDATTGTYWYYWYPSTNPLAERLLVGLNVYGDVVSKVWAPYNETQLINVTTEEYNPLGILSVGGPKANWITRYFNDFAFSILREGSESFALVDNSTVTGSAPTNDPAFGSFDIFPLTTYNVRADTFNLKSGYFVVTLTRDINGTLGVNVWGWDGRDTFWGAAWTAFWLFYVPAVTGSDVLPDGVVAIVVHITYNDYMEPTQFQIEYMLGTITELVGLDASAVDPMGAPAIFAGGSAIYSYSLHGPWWAEKVLKTVDLTMLHWDP